MDALRADRDRGHREPAPENCQDDDTSRDGAESGIPAAPKSRAEGAFPTGAPLSPAAAAPPGTCIVPGCGQRGRRYPAGTLCNTHRPGPEPPPPQTCPECGLALPAHATACAQRPASLWPATDVSYGQRDEITVRQWQQAHLDPDKVRAWCRDTGRGEPPASGALPPDLIDSYLADRGATDIPLPGGPDRGRWLAHRPVLTGPFTVRLGPLTVTYGPCPRCGHPTAADPGDPLPICTDCASQPGGHDSAADPAAGSGELTRAAGAGQPAEPGPAAPGDTSEVLAQITGQQLHEAASMPAPGSGRPTVIPSALDEAALAAMRADAEATAGPFTDPALLRKAELALAGIDTAWLERVVGHPAGSWRSLSHAEMLLAVRAAETDAEHLAALAEAEQQKLARRRQATAAAAQATADAAAAQWQQLRAQLPVPVTVQHNWTARHLDGYEQGADHIVVLEDLHAGRSAGRPGRRCARRHPAPVSCGTSPPTPATSAGCPAARHACATRNNSPQPGKPAAPPSQALAGTPLRQRQPAPRTRHRQRLRQPDPRRRRQPARPASHLRGGDDDETSTQAQSAGSSCARPRTGISRTGCCRSRRGRHGRTAGAAARAAPAAAGRASTPGRYTPAPGRAITRGSRWPAAPTPRSTSGSPTTARTRPGT